MNNHLTANEVCRTDPAILSTVAAAVPHRTRSTAALKSLKGATAHCDRALDRPFWGYNGIAGGAKEISVASTTLN